MSPQEPDRDPSWAWEESRWRAGVEKIRAGRPLRPAGWKGGARVCVALSFDPDHETSTLRDGSASPGRLSQGEFGSRVAAPRILEVLRRHRIPASFFVPGVVALLHSDEQRRVIDEAHEIGMHGWIRQSFTETGESSILAQVSPQSAQSIRLCDSWRTISGEL